MAGLTIIAAPINAVGHVNASIGVTKPFLSRGHRVIFLIEKAFKGKLKALGFEEVIYEIEPNQKAPGEDLAKGFQDNQIIAPVELEEQLRNTVHFFLYSASAKVTLMESDRALSNAIKQYQPDLFFVDCAYLLPAIYYSGKPWVHIMSIMPLFYYRLGDLPPGLTGLTTNSDRVKWPFYNDILKDVIYSKQFGDYVEEMGYPRYPEDILLPKTQLMSIYAMPEEINLPQFRENTNWFNLEAFNKDDSKETFEFDEVVPRQFWENNLNGKYSGKLVYLSLGSMGSIDLNLMRRLVSILSSTKHKYIISKGPRHAEYELSSNMWGEAYLPQTKILPLVDLVISHGGNNTVTEAFAHGKPLLVMPLFGDQLDNATRLEETSLGVKLDPYTFKDHELVEAIDRLLQNQKLNHIYQKATTRIQTSKTHDKLCEKILSLLIK